nr:4Fe-4S dicluster domain-containing protein [Ilumatobacteraceae bacterium]
QAPEDVGVDGARCIDARAGLDRLVEVLRAEGYRTLGPTVRDGVVAYDDLASGTDLPEGVRTEQAPGRFRLEASGDATRFSWTPGADSWKRFVFPPRSEVVRIRRADGTFVVEQPAPPPAPMALVGARDCEIRALAVLDRVLDDPDHPDDRYVERRADTFVVAVTCGVPSATCWCTSMGGDPRPQEGYDLRITEVLDGGHRLLVEAGTTLGHRVLERLDGDPAVPGDHDAAAAVAERARDGIRHRLDGAALPSALAGTDEHAHWADVAARCLSCGSCTSVCPTCFCSSFTDVTDLVDPDVTVREQTWVSCFQLDHSRIGGRPVRATTADRYRQWLTHKLETWHEQFGTSGCVGCGRCSTWCPAGIDLPAEAAALTGVGP